MALVQSLQINLVQQPSKYLGMKFKLRRNRVADFQVLLDKLQAKLQGWKARLLSQAGRTTLISSILQDMPLYTFCSFKVPETITNKMDCIARFWWGNEPGARKLHLLNWDTICCPRKAGGLGIKKFGTMNKAMLAKQYWRMVHNPNSLLAQTFKPKYFPRTSILDCNPKPHHSWIWKNNISQKNSPLGDSRWVVARGLKSPSIIRPGSLLLIQTPLVPVFQLVMFLTLLIAIPTLGKLTYLGSYTLIILPWRFCSSPFLKLMLGWIS